MAGEGVGSGVGACLLGSAAGDGFDDTAATLDVVASFRPRWSANPIAAIATTLSAAAEIHGQRRREVVVVAAVVATVGCVAKSCAGVAERAIIGDSPPRADTGRHASAGSSAAAPWIACAIAVTDWNRSSRRFAIAVMTTNSSPVGTSGRRVRNGGGVSSR